MKRIMLLPILAVVLAVGLALPVTANGAVTVNYGDITLEGGFEAGHFDDVWDLTAGDIVLNFTYDATGLVDDLGGGAHAWAELGVRSMTWASGTVDLIAGQHIDVGDIVVQRVGDDLCVEYQLSAEALAEGWVLTETHLAVAGDPAGLPQTKNGNPIPGKFPYGDDALGVYDGDGILIGGADSYSECISLLDVGIGPEDEVYIAAHAVVGIGCYETVVYGMERYTATVYGVDVLTGESWKEFEADDPPAGGSATPNGLAYDAENGRFYYCDYYAPNTLYFWDTSQHVAGTLLGNVADAGFYDGKYYYITGPPASDDLYEVTFNADGTISAQTKLDDIADGVHGWTFSGDIAVKDGVVYGWGLCGPNSKYEFFTYGLATGDFTSVTPSYQSSLQLAFGSDGTLYGHRSGGDGAFYVIDTTNGDVSKVTPTPDPALLYTDCASGEICVPITETAWGAGLDFPGKNWATYFTVVPSDFNPTWMEEGSGVWLATDYHWAAGTFDPDPEGSPTLDIDDKLILQKAGGHGEADYNLPSTPPNPGANHAVWFDRDGVDQWQALMWGAIDGVTYNTGGTYDVVITLHADTATSGTAYMTINGEPQGFYVPNWHPGPADLMPAGMTFTGDMEHLQVFYGLYGYGATHSVVFTDITVTQ